MECTLERIHWSLFCKVFCSYISPTTANNPSTYLQVEFDTGSCKTFATIAGHLPMAADVRLPTSSKLEGPC